MPEVEWVRDYYSNGQLKFEIPFVSEEKHGLARCWYENGQLKYEYFGKLHGLVRSWYKNRQLYRETPFTSNQRHGLVREWNENGQLVCEMIYVNDEERPDILNSKLAQVVIFGEVLKE